MAVRHWYHDVLGNVGSLCCVVVFRLGLFEIVDGGFDTPTEVN